jgi:hypothetical protein
MRKSHLKAAAREADEELGANRPETLGTGALGGRVSERATPWRGGKGRGGVEGDCGSAGKRRQPERLVRWRLGVSGGFWAFLRCECGRCARRFRPRAFTGRAASRPLAVADAQLEPGPCDHVRATVAGLIRTRNKIWELSQI